MRIGSLRSEVIARLRAAGISRPALEADLLLSDFFCIDRSSLYADPDREVARERAILFDFLVRRRESREPIEYILGKAEFFGLPFSVGPGCLIPRPETELLVELALHECREGVFLDWGTGSGCLAATLLHECPEFRGIAVDASPAALKWAWSNLKKLGLLDRCLLLHADSPEKVCVSSGEIDLVISNPPYIPTEVLDGLMPEVRDYEPGMALDGGPDGLSPYASLISQSARLLRNDGVLIVEIGDARQAEVLSGMNFPGLLFGGVHKDLEGRPRAILWRAYRL